jgi:hypothetical protein
MLPASAGRWHLFTGSLPKNAIQDGGTNPWRIGLRKSVSFAESNRRPELAQGISANSFSLKWKSGQPIAGGKSFDICDPDTKFIEGWSGAVSFVTIWGALGVAACGGQWITGNFDSSKISAGPTNATFRGTVAPFLSLSALPNNLTPTSGLAVTGVTSGATAKFHRVRNTSPAQYALREFSGSAIFQVGEQIQVNGVVATNGGTPVTISALNWFPAAASINLIYVDSVSGYPGRYQIWNSSASLASISVTIESSR